MKKLQEYKTKKTYSLKGGLRGVELGRLKSFKSLRVVAIKHEVNGWKLHYISEDNLIYLDKKKMTDKTILVEKKEECYNCGCNLKQVCPDYEEDQMQVRVQRLHEGAKMPVRARRIYAGD